MERSEISRALHLARLPTLSYLPFPSPFGNTDAVTLHAMQGDDRTVAYPLAYLPFPSPMPSPCTQCKVMNAPDDAERRRIVCVTMAKASARLGMRIVMWWAGVLKGGPEIDVTAIKARRGNAKPAANQSGAGSAGSKKTFSEVYAEAQEMFKAKMRREGKGTPGDSRTVVTLPDKGESDEEGEEDVAGLGVDGIEAAAAAAADAQTAATNGGSKKSAEHAL